MLLDLVSLPHAFHPIQQSKRQLVDSSCLECDAGSVSECPDRGRVGIGLVADVVWEEMLKPDHS